MKGVKRTPRRSRCHNKCGRPSGFWQALATDDGRRVHRRGVLARFRRADLWLALSIMALCAFDLRQYQILFVKFGLYELVPEGLLRALQILK